MIRQAMALLIVVVLASAGSARAAEPPYILVDINSGQVLAERRSGELWYPASLAKLMTIYLLFQALAEDRLELDSPIIISETALRAPPSKMGFPAGTIITVENALKILIVKSANDVAIAAAEMMSGTERSFVAEMNRAGTRLGMIGTRFANPHGLPDDGQYTTARDMALLAWMIWLGFPEYRDLFAIAEPLWPDDHAGRQQPPRILSRRHRHEDRLHLRCRFQFGCDRNAGRSLVDRSGSGRGKSGRPHNRGGLAVQRRLCRPGRIGRTGLIRLCAIVERFHSDQPP